MSEVTTKKNILKSSAIIGAASLITIVIGLFKVKILAIVLGPSGIGIMGLLTSVMAAGATFFGLGLSRSGVRELALNSDNAIKFGHVQKALTTGALLLGFLAVSVALVFRDNLSEWLFDSSDFHYAIAIIGFGIFFSLLSNSQTAVLQGLRKISDIAKVKVFSAAIAAVLGLILIWRLGEDGVPAFIVLVPISTFSVAYFYCRKHSKTSIKKSTLKDIFFEWNNLVKLGFVFMLTGLMAASCQFIVRYIVNQELNIQSVGYFQAAWQISMTYISFILASMAVDYYPRLTQKIHDHEAANLLVNEQTEIAISFSAPILLGMLTFSPIIINILYSNEFNVSSEILRWQVLGDIFKIISWPLSFILVAKGRSGLFFLTELTWNATYILFVYFGIDIFGVEITGYAFAASYILYLITIYLFTIKINGFRWSKNNVKLIKLIIVVAIILLSLCYLNPIIAMFIGLIVCIYATVLAIRIITKLNIKNRKLDVLIGLYNSLSKKLTFKS
jgi:PST family polysaccharide transporter